MLQSIPYVCDVSLFSGPTAPPGAPPDIFIELPHGATRLAHLQQTKTMASQYPGDEHDLFFLANTDQGSPEYATELAKQLTSPEAWQDQTKAKRASSLRILMVRSLLPRAILDVNRVWHSEEDAVAAGLTRGVPDFITNENDLARLREAFDRYHEVVSTGYAVICGIGGFALQLHTYAPRSVNPVEGEYIVDTLRKAYDPQRECPWPKRPEVQLITTPPGGSFLSNAVFCDALENAYETAGVEIKRNDPFNLHPATMAHTYANQYKGQTLTMEISRSLLAETFNPFIEMTIDPQKAESLARPIAEAFLTYHAEVFG